MLRGDVDRFYKKLRRNWPIPPDGTLPELDHVREIASYYGQVTPEERRLLLAWARKEESGIGVIPAVLSGVPVLAVLFAPFLHEPIRRMAPWAWFSIWLGLMLAFASGIYIHQRHKAFTTLHIEILNQLCEADTKQKS